MVVNPEYIGCHIARDGVEKVGELITPGWDDKWIQGYTRVEPLSVKAKIMAQLATDPSGKEAPVSILVDASLLDLPVPPWHWDPRTIGEPLRKVPLFEAIRYECIRLNLKVKLTDDGLLILPAKQSP